MDIPRRPAWISLFNRMQSSAPIRGEKLLDLALIKERSTAFKKDDFKEGFFNLIDAINNEAQLHPLGQFMIKNRTINLLRNRLRIEKFLETYPKINEIAVNDPIIITGLPRTGSTLLHRALSRHPEIRSLKSWEVMHPVPFKNEKQGEKRKRSVRWTTRFLHHISPDFSRIHPTYYDEPEEEVLLLDLQFQNTVNEALMYIPSYVEWANSKSMKEALNYLKQVLKILLWQKSRSKLILKTPAYLEDPKALLEVFPRAKIIHTYRDPTKVMPSFCNLIFYTRHMFSDSVDPKEIGDYFLKRNVTKINLTLSLLDKMNIYHLGYNELMSNPMYYIKEILQFIGLHDSNESIFGIKEFIERQSKFKGMDYTLEDFGLDEEDVVQQFSSYKTLFSI